MIASPCVGALLARPGSISNSMAAPSLSIRSSAKPCSPSRATAVQSMADGSASGSEGTRTALPRAGNSFPQGCRQGGRAGIWSPQINPPELTQRLTRFRMISQNIPPLNNESQFIWWVWCIWWMCFRPIHCLSQSLSAAWNIVKRDRLQNKRHFMTVSEACQIKSTKPTKPTRQIVNHRQGLGQRRFLSETFVYGGAQRMTFPTWGPENA